MRGDRDVVTEGGGGYDLINDLRIFLFAFLIPYLSMQPFIDSLHSLVRSYIFSLSSSIHLTIDESERAREQTKH